VVSKGGKLPTSIGAVGPTGPQGTKGDPGLTGLHLVQTMLNQNTPTFEDTQETVNCPQGESATGGGGLVQQYSTNAFVGLLPLTGDQPTTGSFTVSAGPVSATGHIIVNAYVFCAKVASSG
jgi:hypothetical protein